MTKKILVLSGKGGVGKTTMSILIASGLFRTGKKIGMLDVDVHGPDIPRLLKVEKQEVFSENSKIIPVTVKPGFSLMSIFFMVDQETSVVWRGPMKHNLIRQFVQDVSWDDPDVIVVDFPPGTGDECISAAQLMDDIAGAVIVSTPQQVSIDDSLRAIDFTRKLNIPVLGLVENMSGDIFGQGTIERVAAEKRLPFLGSIPLDRRIVSFFTEENDILERDQFIDSIREPLIKGLKKQMG